MNKRTLPIRLAPAALLAAAALPFAPVLAQTASPDPTASTASDPALADMAPPTAPVPVLKSSPVVQPVPSTPTVASPPPADAAPQPSTSGRHPPNVSQPARAASAAAPASALHGAAGAPSPEARTSAAPPTPVTSQVPVAARQPVADAASGRMRDLEVGGLAGVLVLGGLAIATSRRKRDRIRPLKIDHVPPEVYWPPVAAQAKPLAFAPTADAARPHVVDASPARPIMANVASDGETADELMAMRVPDTVEGRRALIERIAAAEPDPANPFRSPKARLRRARLIVQAMTHRQQEIDQSTPVVGSEVDQAAIPLAQLADA